MTVGIFANCTFCLKVKSLPRQQKKKLQTDITENGGKLSLLLNPQCTHIILDNANVLSRYQHISIQKNHIHIANPDFIWESVQERRLLDVKNYDPRKSLDITPQPDQTASGSEVKTEDLSLDDASEKENIVEFTKFCTEDVEIPHFPQDFEVAKYNTLEKVDVEGGREAVVVELRCSQDSGDCPFLISAHFLLADGMQHRRQFTVKKTSADASEYYENYIEELKKQGFLLREYFTPEATQLASEKLQALLLEEVINSSALSREVGDLVEMIWAEALGHLEHTLRKPVDSISLKDVSKAEGILQLVRAALKTGETAEQLQKTMAEFYRLIPHKAPAPKEVNLGLLAKKEDLCQLIRDLVNVCETNLSKPNPPSLAKYRALRCKIEHVEQNTEEFFRVKEVALQNNRSTSPVEILEIFRVGRVNEMTEFLSGLGNVRPLLHGCPVRNVVGILSRGLLLPKVVEDRGVKRTDIGNLGSGIYFGDSLSTSVKYSHPGETDGSRLLVVCDVALGKCLDLHKKDSSLTEAPAGYDSVHGVSETASVSTDFEDDEFVVYKTNQVKMKYVVKFCMPGDQIKDFHPPDNTELEEHRPEFSDFSKVEDYQLPDTKPPSDIRAGLQDRSGNLVPLKDVCIKGRIIDFVAQVVVFQTYRNQSPVPIEAKYIFPLDEKAAVCGFEAFINGKHIVGEVKEKEEARREYREAVSQGHGAYLMDQHAPDIFTVSVGNLPPKAKVLIKITYITELSIQGAAAVFFTPAAVAPWQQDRALNENLQDTVKKICVKEIGTKQRLSATPTMGNTEFWKTLRYLSLLYPCQGSRDILLVSDGHLQDESLTMQLVKRSLPHTRLFACGVGSTANRHVLRTLSQCGAGVFEYFNAKSKHNWKKQVEDQMARLRSPSCHSVSVKWQQLSTDAPEPLQAPAQVPSLFHNDRLLVYGFIPHCTQRTDCTAVVSTAEGSSLDSSGFSLRVGLSNAYLPRMWVEKHPDKESEACMLVFQPDLHVGVPDRTSNSEVIICLDCSNSMEGVTFLQAKQITLHALSLVGETQKVNVVQFGTGYKELFSYPKYITSSVAPAEFITSATPTMGNTEFWKTLRYLSLLYPCQGSRDILLVSDGHLQDESLTMQLVKRSLPHTRLFACGIEDQMARLRSPSCHSVSVKWQQLSTDAPEPLQAPAQVPSLFHNDRLLVYGFIPHCTQATLCALIQEKEFCTMVSTTELQKTTGTMIHKLTARALIRDYEDGILHENETGHEMKKQILKSVIIKLSKENSLVTQFTSFVAVEKRDESEPPFPNVPKVSELIAKEDVDLLPYMTWQEERQDASVMQPLPASSERDEELRLAEYTRAAKKKARKKKVSRAPEGASLAPGPAARGPAPGPACEGAAGPSGSGLFSREPAGVRPLASRALYGEVPASSFAPAPAAAGPPLLGRPLLAHRAPPAAGLRAFSFGFRRGALFGSLSCPKPFGPSQRGSADPPAPLFLPPPPPPAPPAKAFTFRQSSASFAFRSESYPVPLSRYQPPTDLSERRPSGPGRLSPVSAGTASSHSLESHWTDSSPERRWETQCDGLPGGFLRESYLKVASDFRGSLEAGERAAGKHRGASVVPWTELCSLQTEDGFWKLTPELGFILNLNIDALHSFLKEKGIQSLGVKGRERLLDLIATLLVLQFLRTRLEQEGIVFKSLMKLDDAASISRNIPWDFEAIKKAHEWVRRTEGQYPSICPRLELGKDWDSATKQLLGLQPINTTSPLPRVLHYSQG
ncbi:PREDICTED: poly [ADP-ribose] polymerase 4 [Propithecus coquereli]|uniref:poly [ADP-ribose] polymerase 4 n=1 Tax=Propithecus coquereli TaxID=379532 RepID=UPI00063F8903|nr:PREDICTED: poly [ADP-ribose] polymerase 4 [Propithecus coquereli]